MGTTIVTNDVVTDAFLSAAGIGDLGTATVVVEWGTSTEGLVSYADSCGHWDPVPFAVIEYADGRKVVSFRPMSND